MKTLLSLAFLAVLLLGSGCARNYVLTLNNGSQIGATSKPRLKDGVYVFKDAHGRDTSVPAGRVREVAPASMAGTRAGSQFHGTPSN